MWVHCGGVTVAGTVKVASGNQVSLAVSFEGSFGPRHSGLALLLRDPGGQYRSIITDEVFEVAHWSVPALGDAP